MVIMPCAKLPTTGVNSGVIVELGVGLELGQVLVLEGQAIGHELVGVLARALIVLDHRAGRRRYSRRCR